MEKLIEKYISIDKQRRGGLPCIAGTRFTVAQFLAELSDGESISSISEDFDIDLEKLKGVLEELSVRFFLKIKKE